MHTINKREKSQKYHKCRDFQNQRTNQQSSLNKESGSISGMVTVEDHKTTKKKKEEEIKIRQLEFPAEQGHEPRHVSVARKNTAFTSKTHITKAPKTKDLRTEL